MTPDHVVLGSGGVLGDTWMSGLIAGLLEAGGPDLRLARHFVGTSAGSIVATRLAAGEDLRSYVERRFGVFGAAPAEDIRPAARTAGANPDIGTGVALAPAARMLRFAGPAGRLARRTALKAVPPGDEELSRLGRTIERLMPDWDARLNLVGVKLQRGDRVVMSGEHSLGLSVSEAVRASCAIPGVFRPVKSERGPIVDGGVWSPVNLDAVAPEPGSTVLCLYPSGYRSRPSRRRSVVAGLSRTRVSLEAATMRSRGARVTVVSPDSASAQAIGPDRMDHERDPLVAASAYRQGLLLAEHLAEPGFRATAGEGAQAAVDLTQPSGKAPAGTSPA